MIHLIYGILFLFSCAVAWYIDSPIPVLMFIVLLYLASIAFSFMARDRHPCEDD